MNFYDEVDETWIMPFGLGPEHLGATITVLTEMDISRIPIKARGRLTEISKREGGVSIKLSASESPFDSEEHFDLSEFDVIKVDKNE